MSSIFTKIINHEIPAEIIFENENYIAILDINPVRPGHTLVIPKKEIDYIFDLNDSEYLELMLITKQVAKILENKYQNINKGIKRIGIFVDGIMVPHVHVHLIPIYQDDEFGLELLRK